MFTSNEYVFVAHVCAAITYVHTEDETEDN